MLEQLVTFYYNTIFSIINYLPGNIRGAYNDTQITIFSSTLNLPAYLSLLAGLISVVFILVLCCLFVYKIIKLIGGLIR